MTRSLCLVQRIAIPLQGQWHATPGFELLILRNIALQKGHLQSVGGLSERIPASGQYGGDASSMR